MKLPFPPKILDQHVVTLGKTGAGKSSSLRVIIEYLLSQGKRFVVADPKGDHWGVKSSKDGRSAGHSVIAFGDFKEPKASDVPINGQSGKHVAELITSGNRPCIIGFRGWMPGQMTKFWIDFTSTLFNTNGGELYLIVDEVHNFAPKGKTLSPESALCLHWTNRILSEGRGLGLICLIASQRPQKVHNDTLTCCETLVAMKLIHSADRQAVKDWIDGCGDKAKGGEVLNGLAQLKRGQAWVWSPEIGFGPELIQFPMFETFDSFAPPQLQRRISNSGWADVDLGAVKEKLALVIQEVEANDPKKLKAEIARLRIELSKKPVSIAAPVVEIKRIEVPVFTAKESETCQAIVRHLDGLKCKIIDHMEEVSKINSDVAMRIRAMKYDPVPNDSLPPRRIPLVRLPSNPDVEAREIVLKQMHRNMLTALAQHREGLTKAEILIHTGYAASGPVSTAFADLTAAGLVQSNGNGLTINAQGLDRLGDYDPLPLGDALRHQLLTGQKLSTMEKKLLKAVCDVYPDAIAKSDILKVAEYASSGPVSSAFGKLVAYKYLIPQGPSLLSAAPQLFNT